MKQHVRIPYFKIYRGKQRTSYYFSPPSYIVKQVWESSNKQIRIKSQKLSSEFEKAKREAIDIHETQIRPYLRRTVKNSQLKQSLRYIWTEFKKRRGIAQAATGHALLYKMLSPKTKKFYTNTFNDICLIKSNTGKKFVDLNVDLFTPILAKQIYLKLVEIRKEKCAHNALGLIKTLINFGRNDLGVLKNENAFGNLRIPKPKVKKLHWTEEQINLFANKAFEKGYFAIGWGVLANYYMIQRPGDLFILHSEMIKELEGFHYFELIPQKTAAREIVAYAPIPPHLYDMIKDIKGPILQQNDKRPYGQRTFMKHFLKVRKELSGFDGLTFQAIRNTGSTVYHNAGTTTAENMSMMGHIQERTNLVTYRKNTPQQAIEALKKRLKEETQFS